MAYVVCRVSHFYGIGYREVMDLPVTAFWLMNQNINRLRAEQDLRAIQVAAATQSNEAYRETIEILNKECGEWVKFSPLAPHLNRRDEEGVERLKQMAMGL